MASIVAVRARRRQGARLDIADRPNERFFIAVLAKNWRANGSANGPARLLYVRQDALDCVAFRSFVLDDAAFSDSAAPHLELRL